MDLGQARKKASSRILVYLTQIFKFLGSEGSAIRKVSNDLSTGISFLVMLRSATSRVRSVGLRLPEDGALNYYCIPWCSFCLF